MNIKDVQPNDLFFALDIGTRSVMGILGRIFEDDIHIEYTAVEFHKKRSMIDGQIHDIEKVADCVKVVKDTLEDKSGLKLKHVAIAAAGRSLKTVRLKCEIDIEENIVIDNTMIKSLEIKAIQEAQKKLDEEALEKSTYYNVGHTVINYFLDDGMIINPVGHKGKKLGADIIGTFLPQIVVDSLEAVMKMVDLNISFMTLEPIAAIEVAVPQSARLLNLALVDIGAGTSDIAITKDGSVVAYAMASTAGDEITECIATNFLLDFDAAEALKCKLNKEEYQIFTDIVGIKNEMKTTDILDIIQSSIELVADNIAENILLQNGKSPSAVFMIGGGSQIPRLNELIATRLDLAKERVVIKGAEHINSLSKGTVDLKGPEAVTPVGIMVTSAKNKKNDFMDISVNAKPVRLFRSSDMKVSDALVLAGFNPRDLIPKKGKTMTVMINGEKKSFYGQYGEEAKIYVSGKKGNLESKIEDGDQILVESAVQGQDAKVNLSDIVAFDDTIQVNGDEICYVQNITVNKKNIKNYEGITLFHEDTIDYQLLDNIEKIADYMEMDFESYDFYLNGTDASPDTRIKPNAKIEMLLKENAHRKQKKNQHEINQPSIEYRSIRLMCNGRPIELTGNKEKFVFVDIFDYIKFDRSSIKGKLVTKHNGEQAKYTSELNQGDILEIRWE